MKPNLIIFLSTLIFELAALLLLMGYRALTRTRAVDLGCTCPSDLTLNAACQRCSWAQPEHPHEKVLTMIKRADGIVLLAVGEPGRLTWINLAGKDDRYPRWRTVTTTDNPNT